MGAASPFRFLTRQCADEVDDAATQLGVLDVDERLVELDSLRARKEINHVMSRLPFGEPTRISRRRAARILEEERYGHGQDARDMLQAARANAIGALLVFLDLLEGDPEMLAELFLAHAQHHAAQANPTADVSIDRI